MTEEQLKAIEARAKAATPGPWFVDTDKCVYRDRPNDELIADPSQTNPADAEFIAHAREDIPKLVEEVRRLKAGPAKVYLVMGSQGDDQPEVLLSVWASMAGAIKEKKSVLTNEKLRERFEMVIIREAQAM